MRTFQYIVTIDLDDDALKAIPDFGLFAADHELNVEDEVGDFAEKYIPDGILEALEEELVGKTVHRVTYAGEVK